MRRNYRKSTYPERPCEQCEKASKRVNGYSVRWVCGRDGRAVGALFTCDAVR